MKELILENIKIVLEQEDTDVRLTSPRNIGFIEQNVENIAQIIQQNFKIVDAHYLSIIPEQLRPVFDPNDIHQISITIVLDYLYMYNDWRVQYRRKKYDNLEFKQEDFDNPCTHDIIFRYYKRKYPDDWEEKCSVLLAMLLDDLKIYYKRREQYYNK